MIYFVQGRAGGPIKIGYAGSPEGVYRRLSSIQTGNPDKLVVRKVIEGEKWNENQLHERFAQYRLMGEWFRPADDLAAFSNAVRGEDAVRVDVSAACEIAYEKGKAAGAVDGESEGITNVLYALAETINHWARPFDDEVRHRLIRQLGGEVPPPAPGVVSFHGERAA